MSAAGRLLPVIDATSERFWSSVKNHRMELPRCAACRSFHWPARDRCPHCLADRLEWLPVAGTGSIYSYAVYHQLYHAAFEGALPYNVAIIELDEGPRLVSSVDLHGEQIAIGRRVRIEYEDIEGQCALHRFVLVRGTVRAGETRQCQS